MDRVAVKLEQDLAPMDDSNGEEQVESRSMNQYDHVIAAPPLLLLEGGSELLHEESILLDLGLKLTELL